MESAPMWICSVTSRSLSILPATSSWNGSLQWHACLAEFWQVPSANPARKSQEECIEKHNSPSSAGFLIANLAWSICIPNYGDPPGSGHRSEGKGLAILCRNSSFLFTQSVAVCVNVGLICFVDWNVCNTMSVFVLSEWICFIPELLKCQCFIIVE